MRRWLLRPGVGVLLAAVVLSLVPTLPAAALEVRTHGGGRVLGEVSHQRIEVRLGSGAIARGDVVRFREDDPLVDLRPRLGRGTVAGLEQMVPMAAAALQQGAIVGVNGGYSLPRPTGVPNGLHVTDGILVAGQAVNSYGGGGRPTGRGMLGVQPSGRLIMDELRVDLHLDLPDRPSVPHEPELAESDAGDPDGTGTEPTDPQPGEFDEINRQVWPADVLLNNGQPGRPDGELLLYDDRFGAPIAVPGGSIVVVVDGLSVGSSGRTEGRVVDVQQPQQDTAWSVPDGMHVLVAYGNRVGELADTAVAQRVGVTTSITPARTAVDAWSDLQSGVAGGQLLLQQGTRRPGTEWTDYSAFGESHAFGRQPRTAIGRTDDGWGLLVTIDGRRSDWSAGVTLTELTDTMIALGAVDVVNLDGGGSTTMTRHARIINWPSEPGRYLSDGLFLHAPLPPPSRGLGNACPDRDVPDSGFRDVPGTTHAASIDCLAWWDVTSGVSPTQYAPDAGVTREQMASFVARWIDGVSSRGAGEQLPSADLHGFVDVAPTNVHTRAIARLTEAGIISGRTPTTYEPRRVMTRAQTATLMRGAVEFVTGDSLPGQRDTFLDENGSVHEANIDVLAGAGVIAGVGGFEFRPEGPVTRGAMSALIMRSSDLLVEEGDTTPPSS